MNSRVALPFVLAAAVAIAGRAQGDVPQVFRSSTDVVTVDVTVRSGGTFVGGLKAEDFSLLDNGVKQRVEAVEAAPMPVDVTLIIDVSGGTSDIWQPARSLAEISRDADNTVRKSAALLGPGDRLDSLTIDTYVERLDRAENPPSATSLVAANGRAALHDALLTALLRPIDGSRRHFILAFTKGEDVMSAVSADAIVEVARQSDAVLHIVMDQSSLLSENVLQDCQCALMGLCKPVKHFWTPVGRRFAHPGLCFNGVDITQRPGQHPEQLVEAADVTGGALHDAGLFGNRGVADSLKDVLDDFRRSYLLRYTPRGVKRDGWHDLAVTIPGRPAYTINARRGYNVEPLAPSPRPPAPALRGTPLESIVASYDRGEFDAAARDLRRAPDLARLVRDFRAAGNPWPAAPRREAVFVLELANAMLTADHGLVQDAAKLLADYDALVRPPFGPDQFECLWHWGEIASLEGAIAGPIALPIVNRAAERCPAEPRLRLAQAFVTDQQWPIGVASPGRFSLTRPSPSQLAAVPRMYSEAIKYEAVSAEARVRAAWFAYRNGRFDEALAMIERADEATTDRFVRYLGWLMKGRVYEAKARIADAESAYRTALSIWPAAQSARVALMGVLVTHGQPQEAEALAEAVQTAPPDSFDPWWMYWQGDYRSYQMIVTRLRELAR